MKSVFCMSILSVLFSLSVSANEVMPLDKPYIPTTGLYDVVVPILSSDPASTDRVSGMMYYSISGTQFKGIDNNGNVVALSPPSGSFVSSTGSSERVERVRVANCTSSPCTILSQSGAISSVTRNSTGNYTINFNAGAFSAGPTCTSICNGSAGDCLNYPGTPTATTFDLTMKIAYSGSLQDASFSVICMGPR